MSVIGCDYPSGPVVGAETLIGATGVWSKTHMQRKGHFLCATMYLVAAGKPKVVELKVDMRPIAKAAMKFHIAAHKRMEAQKTGISGEPEIGWGFSLRKAFRSIKRKVRKTVKRISKNKLVRAATWVHRKAYKYAKKASKVASKVLKNKWVQGAITTALTVFPPTTGLGVAAGAAFAMANKAVAAIEAGSKMVNGVRKAYNRVSKGVKFAKKLYSRARKVYKTGKSYYKRGRSMFNRVKRTVSKVRRGVRSLTKYGKNKLRAKVRTMGRSSAKRLVSRVKGRLGRVKRSSRRRTTRGGSSWFSKAKLAAKSRSRVRRRPRRSTRGRRLSSSARRKLKAKLRTMPKVSQRRMVRRLKTKLRSSRSRRRPSRSSSRARAAAKKRALLLARKRTAAKKAAASRLAKLRAARATAKSTPRRSRPVRRRSAARTARLRAIRAKLARAAKLKRTLSNPKVRAKIKSTAQLGNSAKRLLEGIAVKAKYSTGKEQLDAAKSVAIVNLVARNRARVRAMAQTHAGGLPAMLITNQGRIVPGKFRVKATAPGQNPDVLYLGTKHRTIKGHYTQIGYDPMLVGGNAIRELIGTDDLPPIESLIGSADMPRFDDLIGCGDNPNCNCPH